MNRPSRARRIWSISPAVPAQPRHHLGGREAQDRRDVGVVGERVGGGGDPSRCPAARRPVRGRCASAASTAARSSCRPRPGRAPAAGRARDCSPPNSCRARRIASTRSSSASPVGRLAEDVQPVADLDVLDLAQPAVDVQQHVVERVLVGPVVQPEVVVHLRRPHQRPDLLPDGGQLAGVERGDVGVLVEQLFEAGDVAVGFGAGHRRDEVVDQHGVGAALGLGALARVVDQERVDQRQVAERGVGAAGRRHAQRLAGQPLQVAVLAEVHDGVGAETVLPSQR